MSPKYRLFGAKSNGNSDEEGDGYDWAEFMVQGGTIALTLVREAADLAPLPGLKQAAGTVLQIVQTVQAVKDNKSAWKILADESTALIAVVWRSYQTSPSQKDWPPMELRFVIQDLVMTLASIQKHVEEKVHRNFAARFVLSSADVGKIAEYRLKLRHTVDKFEVASHLTINDSLQHLLKGQQQIIRQLEANGFHVERTDAQNILAQIDNMSIDDPPTPPATLPAHVAAVPRQGENIDLLASADRYIDHEREYFAGEKDQKGKQSKSKLYRSATVESDDSEGEWEDDSGSESVEEVPKPAKKSNKPKSPPVNNNLPDEFATNLNGQPGTNINLAMPGMNASMGNTGWPSNQGLSPNPPMSRDTSKSRSESPQVHQHGPSTSTPPPQYTPSPSAQAYPSPPQSYPSSPQPYPPAGQYQTPPFAQTYPYMNQPYPSPNSPYGFPPQFQPSYFPSGVPGMNINPMTGLPYPYPIQNQFMPLAGGGSHAVITNNNSGNVSNMNITNSNNNNSVNTYNGTKRSRRK